MRRRDALAAFVAAGIIGLGMLGVAVLIAPHIGQSLLELMGLGTGSQPRTAPYPEYVDTSDWEHQ
jgi:hypothetical protein